MSKNLNPSFQQVMSSANPPKKGILVPPPRSEVFARGNGPGKFSHLELDLCKSVCNIIFMKPPNMVGGESLISYPTISEQPNSYPTISEQPNSYPTILNNLTVIQ